MFAFLPGLNAPNYHASLLLALPLSLVSAWVAMGRVYHAVLEDEAQRHVILKALSGLLLPLLLPLLILQANGLFVRQCDVFGGIGFYLIGPFFSGLWMGSLGGILGFWAAKFKHLWIGRAAFLALVLFLILKELLHIYWNPAIFVFSPLVGYVQGAYYDSVVTIDSRILLYRLNNLAQMGFLLSASAFFANLLKDHKEGDRRRRIFAWKALAQLGFGMIFLGLSLAFYLNRGKIGYEVSREDLIQELGAEIHDESLRVYYDKRLSKAEAQKLLEAHRFRLHQLETELGEAFEEELTSFVYYDRAQKNRLMGAANVYIAKPWLREIHLNRVGESDSVILHELAHAVLGKWGRGIFHIPTRYGFFPNMALVEGAAAAFQNDTGMLNAHEWAHAMRKNGRAPNLRRVLQPTGFLSEGNTTAYTLSGSFIRYLIDHYGIPSFLKLYETGSFEVYEPKSLESLIKEWEAFVDALEVPDEAMGLALGKFSRIAIQNRPCGLDVAKTEARARALLKEKGGAPKAVALFERVANWIPEDAQKKLPLLELAQQKGLAETEKAYGAYLNTPFNHNVLSDAKALDILANQLALNGDYPSAKAIYEALLDLPSQDAFKRNVLVKRELLEDPLRQHALDYVLGQQAKFLKSFEAEPSDDPLLRYLYYRRFFLKRMDPEALMGLVDLVMDLGLDRLSLRYDESRNQLMRETLRMLAVIYWRQKRYNKAEDAYLQLYILSPGSGDKARYKTMAEWARYQQQ